MSIGNDALNMLNSSAFLRRQESSQNIWIDFVEPLKRVPGQARNVVDCTNYLYLIPDGHIINY